MLNAKIYIFGQTYKNFHGKSSFLTQIQYFCSIMATEMTTILIADSGSTKTDWLLASGYNTQSIATQGINPFHQDAASITTILQEELVPNIRISPTHIYFYGAGCNEMTSPRIVACLHSLWPNACLEAASDLLGAARALCGHKAGMAAILGTGSNSCLYDGERIVNNVPPLGYILGDEGSGAALGKLLLNAIYKDDKYGEIRQIFEEETGLAYAEVIRRTYREPLANRFLASLAPFIKKHVDRNEVCELIRQNFRQFFERNIRQYHSTAPINAVGSIATHFENQLRSVANEQGYTIGTIMQKPIEALLRYHVGDGQIPRKS